MKVLFIEDILPKILEIKKEAEIEMKVINYIELTEAEWNKLKSELNQFSNCKKAKYHIKVYGIDLFLMDMRKGKQES